MSVVISKVRGLPTRMVIVAALAIAAIGIVAPVRATASLTPSSPIAVTDKGVIRGTRVGDMRVFRGVPYAAPPVGNLRWRPPQPAARWPGIRDASTFGNHCAQSAGAFGTASTSEDCLFLNVYMPKFAHVGVPFAPVMVWIHGGALVVGQSDVYDPTALVERGVVVVTINYRLGALGFLAHPALAAESPQGAAGNYGLMDQQAALRWVQRNIRNFGGNPHNVTIFGESAGGLSVHTQLASPRAAGLFDKAIVESGAYQLNQQSLASAETNGSNFAASAGCLDQTAACLRGLPVETILAKQTGGAPTVDGFILTSSVGDAFRNGTFNKVPVIEGSNHDEWRLFVAQTEVAPGGAPLTAAGYIPAIQRTLGVSAAVATALAARYPLANFNSPSEALGALGTDVIFACNARVATAALAAVVPTYQYEFNDPNAPQRFFSGVSFPTGAYHAAEIQFVFPTSSTTFSPDQQQLSRAMVSYWAHFAWFSNPNGFDTAHWPKFDATGQQNQLLAPGAQQPVTTFKADHQCAA